ncbi:RimK family protein [Candidatus Nitrosacidococcus tergens]|uniref:RimK domain protein ATP-grasp n=1 Tax=Candidatus Nitrosacidococcus tergens TaxID=553981 RepID=A0A7G1QAP1_9GAMM|nr:RimK family protein [Candidatus Nitrosacidococcus tergens]CAB1276809.1 RimK domain protein ATP-grasp [Candidatus Nitrosacidococcus tergens]
MAEHLLLLDRLSDWKESYPSLPIISAKDYLTLPEYAKKSHFHIINLCRSYHYLNLGYYCSLLAEARGHKSIPMVRTIQDLSRKAIYSLDIENLTAKLDKILSRREENKEARVFTLVLFFGLCEFKELKELGRLLFETFRTPILQVEFQYHSHWRITAIKPFAFSKLTSEQANYFFIALEGYLSQPWRKPKSRSHARYDLAILHNPKEQLSPSDPIALNKFIRVGKRLGVNVELIQKQDYGRLAEYDALFIRETTQIDHHTYRFAKKAEREGMVVIDDPDSILRCTNKIYLKEILESHHLPIPKTVMIHKKNWEKVEQHIPYPVVIKIPDGSFSRGVFKATDKIELAQITQRLFKKTDLLLAQEFVYTDFDWRLGVLNKKPLFACRYFMSKKHWQIVNHNNPYRPKHGKYQTLNIEDIPSKVMKVGLKAANLIGDGLYGVDLKETPHGVKVIEINDNPNIDAGVEDGVLKDKLYEQIIETFVVRIEQKK